MIFCESWIGIEILIEFFSTPEMSEKIGHVLVHMPSKDYVFKVYFVGDFIEIYWSILNLAHPLMYKFGF